MRECSEILVELMFASVTSLFVGKPGSQFMQIFKNDSPGHFRKSDQSTRDPEPKNQCILINSCFASWKQRPVGQADRKVREFKIGEWNLVLPESRLTFANLLETKSIEHLAVWERGWQNKLPSLFQWVRHARHFQFVVSDHRTALLDDFDASHERRTRDRTGRPLHEKLHCRIYVGGCAIEIKEAEHGQSFGGSKPSRYFVRAVSGYAN